MLTRCVFSLEGYLPFLTFSLHKEAYRKQSHTPNDEEVPMKKSYEQEDGQRVSMRDWENKRERRRVG